MRKTEIILREGTFTVSEIVDMCDFTYSTFVNQITRNKKKIELHCMVEQHGTGESSTFTLSNVPKEPISIKDFGKDPNRKRKKRKERDDKGMSREDYNTIKEEFKPLIYNVLLTKPNFSYTATLSNWLYEAKLVEKEYLTGKKRLTEEMLEDGFTQDFLSVEGNSLSGCFISALESMSKNKFKGEKNRGRISWYKKKIAINLDGEEVTLGDRETAEIINIEVELLVLFEVSSRTELSFKSRKKLKEFDVMFRMILEDRYGYVACYTAYQVVAKLGAKKNTLAKNIEEAKEWYGLTDKIDEKIEDNKNNIYESRKQRAEIRHRKKIRNINDMYNEDLQCEVCDGEFVSFLKELDLSDVGTLEDYMTKWTKHYSIYINKKL